jgi:hypothetical protein
MGMRSAIFIQHGVPAQKQADACLDYATTEHWVMRHYVPYWAPEDAVNLAKSGAVDVILTAFDSPAVRQLAEDVDGHGRVMYVHPEPTVVEPRRSLPASVVDLILRWARRGKSVEQIAADVDGDTSDIRELLRREGEQPDQTD